MPSLSPYCHGAHSPTFYMPIFSSVFLIIPAPYLQPRLLRRRLLPLRQRPPPSRISRRCLRCFAFAFCFCLRLCFSFGLFDHLLTPPAGPSHRHPPPGVCLPLLCWRNHIRQHHRLHRLSHRHTFACTCHITHYFPPRKNVTRQPDAPCSPHLRLSFRLLLFRILPPAGQSLGPSLNP